MGSSRTVELYVISIETIVHLKKKKKTDMLFDPRGKYTTTTKNIGPKD